MNPGVFQAWRNLSVRWRQPNPRAGAASRWSAPEASVKDATEGTRLSSSSAMSSGRLSLDRVARQQSPSLFHRQLDRTTWTKFRERNIIEREMRLFPVSHGRGQPQLSAFICVHLWPIMFFLQFLRVSAREFTRSGRPNRSLEPWWRPSPPGTLVPFTTFSNPDPLSSHRFPQGLFRLAPAPVLFPESSYAEEYVPQTARCQPRQRRPLHRSSYR